MICKFRWAVRPAFRFGVVDADRHREPQRCWAWRGCAALPGRLAAPDRAGQGIHGRLLRGGRDAESRELEVQFRVICQQTSTPFFAAGDVAQPSAVDGIHLDPDGQHALGHAHWRCGSRELVS